jgi:hypothetical protein
MVSALGLWGTPAFAHGDIPQYVAYALGINIIPNGVALETLARTGASADWRGLLTWSTQIPLQARQEGPHRALVSLDLIFARSDQPRSFWDGGVRGRAGYRYLVRDRLALETNVSYDAETRFALGGEVGLFTVGYPRPTIIVKPELGLADRSVRVSLLIGWTVI